MFCSQCGSEIPDGSKFCKACGAEQRVKDNSQAEMYMSTQPNPYAQPSPYAQPNPYMQVNPHMMANPYAQPNPYDPAIREEMKARRKEKFTKFLKILANFILICGLLVNIESIMVCFIKLIPRFDRLKDDEYYSGEQKFAFTYDKGIFKIVLILILISLGAYITLLISKRIIYTIFYPIISLVLSVLFFVVTFIYIRDYEDYTFKTYNYYSHPDYMMNAYRASIYLIIALVLILIFWLLYNIKGFKWALGVNLLFGAAATVFGLYAIGRIGPVSDEMLYVAGNFFGYSIVVLLYAFAYKDKNKPLLNSNS